MVRSFRLALLGLSTLLALGLLLRALRDRRVVVSDPTRAAPAEDRIEPSLTTPSTSREELPLASEPQARVEAETGPDVAADVDAVPLLISGRVVTDRNEGLVDIKVPALLQPDGRAIPAEAYDFAGFFDPAMEGEKSARTDARGYFEIELEKKGKYAVIVSPRDSVSVQTRTEVAPGTRDLLFVLPDLGGVFVRFVSAETKEEVPASSFFHPDQYMAAGDRIWWRPSGEAKYRKLKVSTNDIREHIELEVLLGPTDFYFEFEDHVPQEILRVQVFGRPDPVIEVPLEPGITVRFRFEGPEPSVALMNMLFLVDDNEKPTWEMMGDRNARQVSVSRQGAAELEGLAPGRYYLRSMVSTIVLEPSSFVFNEPEELVHVKWSRSKE